MLFRVSLPNPDGDVTHGPVPVPGFGTQLNNRAIFGVPPEGTVTIDYTEGELTTSDGVRVYLRTPRYRIEDTYQPLPDDVEISPRVAPVVFGLGLLEAIPESTILALVDEADRDGDGISGKANYVWDVQKNRVEPWSIRLEGESADAASTGCFCLPRRHRHYNLAVAKREFGLGNRNTTDGGTTRNSAMKFWRW